MRINPQELHTLRAILGELDPAGQLDGKKGALESAIEGTGMRVRPKCGQGAEKQGGSAQNPGFEDFIRKNGGLKPNLSTDFRFGGGMQNVLNYRALRVLIRQV